MDKEQIIPLLESLVGSKAIRHDQFEPVANGVLVVRTINHCARLLYEILTGTLDLEVRSKEISNDRFLLLVEKSTNCVVRAITANKSLTNSFWNYYND